MNEPAEPIHAWREHLKGDEAVQVAELESRLRGESAKATIIKAEINRIRARAIQRSIRQRAQ